MDWELTNINMEIPGIIIAYIIVFVLAIINVRK
jgi:hypothetical protein